MSKKTCEKWLTLTNYFSADFLPEFPKFCTGLSELPKSLKTRKFSENDEERKLEKNCFWCLLLDKLSVHEFLSSNTISFVKINLQSLEDA